MSLTVEDGSVVEGAESYISVADANTYHTNMGNAGWTGSDTVKEVALRKATIYIDRKYADKWKGQRALPGQPLMWPRNYVIQFEEEQYTGYALTPVYINSNEIPKCLKDAVCEAALIALTGNLTPAMAAPVKRKIVANVIDTTYETSDAVATKYTIIEHALRSLLKNTNVITIERS